jgi:hypothetical protein
MNTEPLIIQQGSRRAVVDGERVYLLKLHNKKKPTGVWPETPVVDETARLLAAHMWVMKGFIDLPGANKQ